ncbi:MAG: ABC transporter permease [Bacteroidota bacterium]
MKLGYLAYRNMVSKPLNLILSLALLVLSVSLVTYVVQLSKQLNGQLSKNITPFDMVVGAKGSPLQLVLSSVLHIDVPTGNIPLQEAERIAKNPFVASATPVSYGDNYKGYRLLGTKLDYLEAYGAVLADGRHYNKSFEVVVGSGVAQRLSLGLGDTFVSSHGLAAAGGEVHDDKPYTVVGLLKPTGTVIDQLLVCNLESVWEAHDHGTPNKEDNEEHEGHDEGKDHDGKHAHEHEANDHQDHPHAHQELEEHADHKHSEHDGHDEDLEITSLLVKFKNPLGLIQMPRYINENTELQAALPGFEVQRLMGLLGSGVQTINGIAIAILIVSGFSIFICLLKTIREKRQELALLRTYGFGTPKLLLLVLYEGLLYALIGFWIGWILGRLALWITSNYLQSVYGYVLQISGLDVTELWFLGVTLLIAVIAVILASTSIFKLNISKVLSDA